METVLEIKIVKRNKVSMDVITALIEYCKRYKIETIINDKVIKVVR